MNTNKGELEKISKSDKQKTSLNLNTKMIFMIKTGIDNDYMNSKVIFLKFYL